MHNQSLFSLYLLFLIYCLKDMATESLNVHYIDERKAVNDDQWYNEIQPNKSGFQTIAGRFIEKIDNLLGA